MHLLVDEKAPLKMEKGFLPSSNYGVQKGCTNKWVKGTFFIKENDFPNEDIWSY
jgi:hypothetical protein